MLIGTFKRVAGLPQPLTQTLASWVTHSNRPSTISNSVFDLLYYIKFILSSYYIANFHYLYDDHLRKILKHSKYSIKIHVTWSMEHVHCIEMHVSYKYMCLGINTHSDVFQYNFSEFFPQLNQNEPALNISNKSN